MCVNPKYNIRRRLLKLPGTFQENMYKLCIEVGIHHRTLERWMALKKGDRFSIPSDEFYLIAHFLACNPNDLINYDPDTQNSENLQLQ